MLKVGIDLLSIGFIAHFEPHGADSGEDDLCTPYMGRNFFIPQAPSSATARGIWQRCKMVKFAGLASSEETRSFKVMAF